MGLFGAFDTLFPIFFIIVFALVIGTFVVVLGRSARSRMIPDPRRKSRQNEAKARRAFTKRRLYDIIK